MAEMTIRGYARHRGVSNTAVQKAISSGRITPLPNGQIDPAVADRQWEANTGPRYPRDDDDGFGAS